jgi:hypothetical protein
VLEIGLRHETAWEVSAHDEIVDVLEEFFDTWIDFVQIGDHWYAGSTGPFGRCGSSGGIVTIDVERPRVLDPCAVELFGLENESFVASAKNSPFTGTIHQYQGLRTCTAGDCNESCLNASASKCFLMESRGIIVT